LKLRNFDDTGGNFVVASVVVGAIVNSNVVCGVVSETNNSKFSFEVVSVFDTKGKTHGKFPIGVVKCVIVVTDDGGVAEKSCEFGSKVVPRRMFRKHSIDVDGVIQSYAGLNDIHIVGSNLECVLSHLLEKN